MKPTIMHIAELGLRVRDLEAMTAFYEELLGLETELTGPNYVFLKVAELESPLGGVGHPQMLVLFDRGDDPDSAEGTLDHLAFEIPEDEYETQRSRLEAKGFDLRQRSWPDTLAWRARSLFFRDPEGNVIEFICRWKDDDDRMAEVE
jgi:catechol 2,3-dioxygenase-like lactoylglutathione lyase family enzyme